MFFIKRLINTRVKRNDVSPDQLDELNYRFKLNNFKKVSFKGVMTLLLVFGLLVPSFVFSYSGTDPLAAVLKPQMQALFGAGSRVAYCIYITEIVFGGVVYAKTKNLLTLLGMAIFLLSTHAMFIYIGS